jgi:NAD+ diphosphatase
VTTRARPLTFASGHHDRLVERRRDDAWCQRQWSDPQTRVLVVRRDQIQVDAGSPAEFWTTPAAAAAGERYLLGADDAGSVHFAVRVADDSVGDFRTLRELVPGASSIDASLLCHAVALAQWHATHSHCPRCGAPTEVAAAGAERRCPDDGSSHFPRVDPAVIVLVTDSQNRALLGRQDAWAAGRFSTLAGFVEPGETAEQAVVREVAEEAGVLVSDVELLATQPWPFPSSLMVGASARVEGTPEAQPDGEELVEARWFSREELREAVASGAVVVPGSLSISRWLIDRWYGGDLPDSGAVWR